MGVSPSLSQAAGNVRLFTTFLLWALVASVSQAVTFTSEPAANLDLSSLGRVGLAGNFDAISVYQYKGENEDALNTNGSQSVLVQLPDGDFTTYATADAGIQAMCAFYQKDGTLAGIVVGGNFTSFGGVESAGVAMIDPNSTTVTPLPGLAGQVSALLCDADTNTVYVGGSFRGANSTNAIAWVGGMGWSNLPFEGFNGPVNSITKSSSGNIIFGGAFTGLGNSSSSTTTSPNSQIINISGANITATSTTTTAGFDDPTNIVCKENGTDGAGNTWLLADNEAGAWQAKFGFGFEPTKLRLWNTHQDGRGTQTWRFTALPINGIMNFTYIDPATGNNLSCSSECPLSSNTSIEYQDFMFVNVIGMNEFRIDISAWYGSGGGLDGIELFEDNIFSYAINNFNEPTCAGLTTKSNATATGPWSVNPSLDSSSQYLTASLSGDDSTSVSVTFQPDVRQSGNYSINLYTPGCLQDDTCDTRGSVTITGIMDSDATESFEVEIWETNDYDKYDQIFFGYVEASSDNFRPSITLTANSTSGTAKTIVAQRVGLTLTAPAGGLNSLFEYDPSQVTIDTSAFTNSSIDMAGKDLPDGVAVTSMATLGDITYVGGNFSATGFSNIMQVNSTAAGPLAGQGLNAMVLTMLISNTTLYVGGNFTGTADGNIAGLQNVASYDTSRDAWIAMGAGVNGQVLNIVPISLNITSDTPETVITISGNFDQIIATGSGQNIPVSGFAVWVPSQNDWLQNLNASTVVLTGQLTAAVDIPSSGSFVAGALSSQELGANGVVSLESSSRLSALPINIQPSSSPSGSLSKRASSSQNSSGVVTGSMYKNGDLNVTILGGRFTATGTNGSTINNLLFFNGSNSDAVTGLPSGIDSDSTFMAVAAQNNTLYAGGVLSGTVNGNSINGLVSYDLVNNVFDTQPPALQGDDVAVYAVTINQKSGDVYVGGSFDSAGSLSCPGVCLFTASSSQWNRPGSGLSGTANTLVWASTSSLIAGGSLTLGGSNVSLATYSTSSQTWAAYDGASSIPGPVTALTPADNDVSSIWVAGTATNGSAFLMKYDGKTWNSVGDVFGSSTVIQGIQVLSLTESHDSTDLVSSSQILMVMGQLELPGFGNASAALFNGTTFQPYILTNTATGESGSLSQIFTEKQNFFQSSGKWHPPPLLSMKFY